MVVSPSIYSLLSPSLCFLIAPDAFSQEKPGALFCCLERRVVAEKALGGP